MQDRGTEGEGVAAEELSASANDRGVAADCKGVEAQGAAGKGKSGTAGNGGKLPRTEQHMYILSATQTL